jgi:phosphoribosylglycinamide formyltransferase 1
MIRIAVLASGSGTNAENIIRYFAKKKSVEVTAVISNKKNAKVLERASDLKIPTHHFDKKSFFEGEEVVTLLSEKADFIILAGFLLKIPQNILTAFPNKIVNIHPALLPKFGGKGMYGMHVHNAVKAQKEKETGITIHYVNENYDEGAIIFQAKTAVSSTDSAEDIAKNIHILEQKHFPNVIESVLLNKE